MSTAYHSSTPLPKKRSTDHDAYPTVSRHHLADIVNLLAAGRSVPESFPGSWLGVGGVEGEGEEEEEEEEDEEFNDDSGFVEGGFYVEEEEPCSVFDGEEQEVADEGKITDLAPVRGSYRLCPGTVSFLGGCGSGDVAGGVEVYGAGLEDSTSSLERGRMSRSCFESRWSGAAVAPSGLRHQGSGDVGARAERESRDGLDSAGYGSHVPSGMPAGDDTVLRGARDTTAGSLDGIEDLYDEEGFLIEDQVSIHYDEGGVDDEAHKYSSEPEEWYRQYVPVLSGIEVPNDTSEVTKDEARRYSLDPESFYRPFTTATTPPPPPVLKATEHPASPEENNDPPIPARKSKWQARMQRRQALQEATARARQIALQRQASSFSWDSTAVEQSAELTRSIADAYNRRRDSVGRREGLVGIPGGFLELQADGVGCREVSTSLGFVERQMQDGEAGEHALVRPKGAAATDTVCSSMHAIRALDGRGSCDELPRAFVEDEVVVDGDEKDVESEPRWCWPFGHTSRVSSSRKLQTGRTRSMRTRRYWHRKSRSRRMKLSDCTPFNAALARST